MRIQYASDLHLEFADNSNWLKNHPLVGEAEILVLAGDIGYLGDATYKTHPFWSWAAERYKQVIVVPGNHEFYRLYDMNELHPGWVVEIKPNIHVYYNCEIKLDADTSMIVSTLWSHIPPSEEFLTENSVSDFKRIRDGKYRLTSSRFNEEHTRCRNFIEGAVAASCAKTIIVVSHHVPSLELMAHEFKDSLINGAFVVELGNFIASSKIKYWIYGHSHRNIDTMIGNTQCLSNQLGYVMRNEHFTFNRAAIIEI